MYVLCITHISYPFAKSIKKKTTKFHNRKTYEDEIHIEISVNINSPSGGIFTPWVQFESCSIQPNSNDNQNDVNLFSYFSGLSLLHL